MLQKNVTDKVGGLVGNIPGFRASGASPSMPGDFVVVEYRDTGVHALQRVARVEKGKVQSTVDPTHYPQYASGEEIPEHDKAMFRNVLALERGHTAKLEQFAEEWKAGNTNTIPHWATVDDARNAIYEVTGQSQSSPEAPAQTVAKPSSPGTVVGGWVLVKDKASMKYQLRRVALAKNGKIASLVEPIFFDDFIDGKARIHEEKPSAFLEVYDIDETRKAHVERVFDRYAEKHDGSGPSWATLDAARKALTPRSRAQSQANPSSTAPSAASVVSEREIDSLKRRIATLEEENDRLDRLVQRISGRLRDIEDDRAKP